MPIERQPGLQPERIASAQADRSDHLVLQQRPRHRLGLAGRNGNLKAVLAGIARPRDMAVDAAAVRQGEFGTCRRHEGQAGALATRTGQNGGRRRPLQRQQGPVLHGDVIDVAGQMRPNMRVVRLLARRIDDQHQPAVVVRRGRARDDQVVENAAGLVEQQRIAHAPGAEALEGPRRQRLQRLCRGLMVGTGNEALAHMRDVEQAGLFTRPGMFGDNAFKLHRHGIAGKRHQPAAERFVQRCQRCFLETAGLRACRCHFGPRVKACDADRGPTARPRPLCHGT